MSDNQYVDTGEFRIVDKREGRIDMERAVSKLASAVNANTAVVVDLRKKIEGNGKKGLLERLAGVETAIKFIVGIPATVGIVLSVLAYFDKL